MVTTRRDRERFDDWYFPPAVWPLTLDCPRPQVAHELIPRRWLAKERLELRSCLALDPSCPLTHLGNQCRSVSRHMLRHDSRQQGCKWVQLDCNAVCAYSESLYRDRPTPSKRVNHQRARTSGVPEGRVGYFGEPTRG